MEARNRWTVLVTGAGGLIGSAVCRSLADQGHSCIALSRRAPTGLGDGIPVVSSDVRDAEGIGRVLATHGVDTVFHLAGESQVGRALQRPQETFEVNVAGTWNVLGACREHGIARVVLASSERVYARAAEVHTEVDPLPADDPYGASKVASDVIGRSYWSAYGLPVAVARLTNVYGEGDRNLGRLIPGAIADVLAGRRPVILSDGTPRHDYLHADDAAAAYLAIARTLDEAPEAARGMAFNVGAGNLITVREVAELICRLAGSGLEPDIRGQERVGPRVGGRILDCTRLTELTGWRPRVGFEEGLTRTIEYYRASALAQPA